MRKNELQRIEARWKRRGLFYSKPKRGQRTWKAILTFALLALALGGAVNLVFLSHDPLIAVFGLVGQGPTASR